MGGVSLFSRFLPSDPDAAGRVHPPGSGDPVQQRQGAGPAEPAGQVHEERRYQPSSPTHTHENTQLLTFRVWGSCLMRLSPPPPPPSDASKAAFMASPSSCFLANRNKVNAAIDQSVKNESVGEQHTYMSLSTNHQQSLEPGAGVYQSSDAAGFTVSGKKQNVMDSSPGPAPSCPHSASLSVSVRLHQVDSWTSLRSAGPS